jgi:hypothetical protein
VNLFVWESYEPSNPFSKLAYSIANHRNHYFCNLGDKTLKDIFTPQDFMGTHREQNFAHYCALVANEKLKKIMETWPVVYSWGHFEGWYSDNTSACTHVGRVAFAEEIPKEPCKHEPDRRWQGQFNPDAYPEGRGLKRVDSARCIHCGVELVPEWKEKK